MTMGWLDNIFGGHAEAEEHEDGNTTTRFHDGTSVTKDPDGNVLEQTSHEHQGFFGIGREVTVTRNGDDQIINAQEGWGGRGKKD